MTICYICENVDKLQQCPECKMNVCSLCFKYDVCDICLRIQMEYQNQYDSHKRYIKEQLYQLEEVKDKLKDLDLEIILIQRNGEHLKKQKSESLDFQISETLLDKQHELEDLELETQAQQTILDRGNEELNILQIQQLKLQTLNQKQDLCINEQEKEYEILQDQLNLKKQQIYQILQTLKNKTSLIRGSYDVDKHYSSSRLTLTAQQQQQKQIQPEEEKQSQGLCSEKCLIQ